MCSIDAGTCYCGHDCSRCLTYLATVRGDDSLRKQSQRFYRDTMGMDIPLEKLRCLGGSSNQVFDLCEECPFRKCCRERGIDSCQSCIDYPCRTIAQYQRTFANKCNQIHD